MATKIVIIYYVRNFFNFFLKFGNLLRIKGRENFIHKIMNFFKKK